MTQVDNMAGIEQSVVDRVKAIEARWGKSFMEVMIDVHDHIFGVSSPAPAPEAPEDPGDTPNTPVDPNDPGAQQDSSQGQASGNG